MLLHVALKNLVFDIVFHSEQYVRKKLFLVHSYSWDVTRSISIDRYQYFGATFCSHLEYSRMSIVALRGNGVA